MRGVRDGEVDPGHSRDDERNKIDAYTISQSFFGVAIHSLITVLCNLGEI